ncbi:MAG TPA: acyl-CoA dehydrogenase family protein [Acidimicrobiales bacterium]|nr:acyl-CoA dehydrogenase family protein [Acidimicrobiales bacterium]
MEPDEDEFLEQARLFLNAKAAEHRPPPISAKDAQRIALFPDLTPSEEAAELTRARSWRQERFDAGFGWISGPPTYGGRGMTKAFERSYQRLEREYDLPGQRLYDIGIGMLVPTILAWGTDLAKERYLRPLQRGDVVGCQLFSEPAAGSDLAGVETRAVRVGEDWKITGQKMWSSGAHLSDVGLLICRSGDKDDRHRNLTAFLLPMTLDGVSIRPIRQMTGGSSFNEVFLDGVVIPDSLRLGEIDEGWQVVLTTLMNERAAVGSPSAGGIGIFRTERLIELVKRSGRLDDPVMRDRLIRLHCDLTVAKLTRQRSETSMRAGQRPGPEMSIGKLALTNNLRSLSDLVSLALGPRLIADDGTPDGYAWSELILGIPGLRLGGGTDEIQKNIVAERVLGLPRS